MQPNANTDVVILPVGVPVSSDVPVLVSNGSCNAGVGVDSVSVSEFNGSCNAGVGVNVDSGPVSVSLCRSISLLQDEIVQLCNLKLYYEIKIHRKELAIQELLSALQASADQLPAPAGIDVGVTCDDVVNNDAVIPVVPSLVVVSPPLVKHVRHELTVKDMIRRALPDFNGSVFSPSKMRDYLLTLYPEHETRIRNGVGPSCIEMLTYAELKSVRGGYIVKKQSTAS